MMKKLAGARDREERARLDSLRRLALFAGCPDDELRRVDLLISLVRVDAGTTLTLEGAPGRQAIVIAEGTAEATRHGERVAVLGPGEIVGEIALLSGAPRTATVTALTPMLIFVLNRGEFNELLRTSDHLRARIERTAGHRAPA